MAGNDTLNAAPKPAAVKVFNCPSCGGGVVLRAAGQSVTAVCGSCAAIIDTTNENYKMISRASKAMKQSPLIPLGQRGKIKGVLWEVVGYVERTDSASLYAWREYLLFNPMRGFRWLTEADGHWNYVIMTKEKPVLDSGEGVTDYGRRIARYMGKKYYLFNRGTAIASYVIGEFYWQLTAGEKNHTEDYVCPPEILSSETNQNEIVWSIGEYIEAATVKSAFQINKPMPAQSGVAPNQFSSLSGTSSETIGYWIMFLSILILMQFAFLIISANQTVYSQTYDVTNSNHVIATPPFELTHGTTNVEVTASAGVQNNWLEVQADLVNDDDGSSYDLEEGIEYYFGYDSDGGWSEGSQTTSETLSSIPEGHYHLDIDLSGPGLPADGGPIAVTFVVKRDVATWGNFFWALLLISIYPLILWWLNRSFEMARWSQSDYTPFASQRGGDDD